MQKMFACEDGTMFPIDDVLSVVESKKYPFYSTREGHLRSPETTFTSKKDLEDAIQKDLRRWRDGTFCEILEEGLSEAFMGLLRLGWRPIRKIFGLHRRAFCSHELSPREVEEWTERMAKERWDFYVERGYYSSSQDSIWCLKRWDVKVKNQKKSFQISNADYERLSAEIGNRV